MEMRDRPDIAARPPAAPATSAAERRRERWRLQKRRQRQREREGERVAAFRYNADRLNKLIALGHLAAGADADRAEIGSAVERLIDSVDMK
jgi:hypothetical protein